MGACSPYSAAQLPRQLSLDLVAQATSARAAGTESHSKNCSSLCSHDVLAGVAKRACCNSGAWEDADTGGTEVDGQMVTIRVELK